VEEDLKDLKETTNGIDFWSASMKKRDHSEDQEVDGKIL
jgi:hypothetical protein